MAKLVLGIGSSHGPTIRTPPNEWERIAERDKRDSRYDYEELLRNASPEIRAEITPEKKKERFDACRAAIVRLAQVIRRAAPDLVVVVSNMHSVVGDDTFPVFGVFRGSRLIDRSAEVGEKKHDERTAAMTGPAPVKRAKAWEGRREYPGHPELADHLIGALIEEGFDIASSMEFRPEHGLDEAFSTFYELYQPEGTLPMVPFLLNRYLPSQAPPRRCYALGQALRRAIESWSANKKVALMASGGLSHQILDEAFDRQVIDALREKKVEVLRSLPRERLNRAPGTPEILNWVTLAGAMEPIAMTLVDYVPCYRSPAGTGHGVTFAYWS